MNDGPLLSFIVLSYNYEDYIGQAIQSILDQTVRDFEIIVVDDASRDRSCDIIRGFDDARIRLLINDRNLGGAASYNRAVQAATGRYLVNLDADDWIAPNKAERQLAAMERQPVEILGTYAYFVDKDGRPHPQAKELEQLTNQPHDLNKVGAWIGHNYLVRSTTMVDRAAHLRIGLDDPSMVRAPDFELWTRALRAGCRFGVLAEPLTYYRLHPKGVTHGDPVGTFLELSYASLRNLGPLDDARGLSGDLPLIAKWFLEQRHKTAYPLQWLRLLGMLIRPSYFVDFADFANKLNSEDEANNLDIVDRRLLAVIEANIESSQLEKLESDIRAISDARDFWQQQAEAGVRRLQANLDAVKAAQQQQNEASAENYRSLQQQSGEDIRRLQANLDAVISTISDSRNFWQQQAEADVRRLQANLDTAEADRQQQNAAWEENYRSLQQQAEADVRHLQANLDTAEADRQQQNAAWEENYRSLQQQAEADVRRLQANLGTTEADRVHNYTELTTCLTMVQSQLAAAQADLETQTTADTKLEIEGTAHSRVSMLRRAAGSYARLARSGRKVIRVLWWSVQNWLTSQLGLHQGVWDQLYTGAVGQYGPSETPPFVQPGPVEALLPSQARPALGQALAIRRVTGHRPRQLVLPEQPHDWPLVSVVVVSFNYGQFVTDAVDSVLAQTFKDLEVIVVEGGSSNAEARLVVAGLQRPRTRVLMNGFSHLVGANRNFGISQARGRYICCLDADDTLAPTYIEKAVFLLERYGYDVVSSAMEMHGGSQGQIDILENPDLSALLDANHVLTCAVFRRSFWERAGGYRDVDPTILGHVHEDWAFWIRLAALGARFWNLSQDPMLLYRVHEASLSRGQDVPPMLLQRQIVREMNRDVLPSIADGIARSKRLASIRYGTPCAPPALITLDRTQGGQRQPTLLLAMPFLILGGAERLLSALVGHLVEMGWRVIVTTSISPGTQHGDTTKWFERHTCEIFHLPRGLPSELWEDFLHHLVRSRSVDVIWVVGSALAYDCLRGLRAAHSGLRVADLLFNTEGHTANNRRRRDLIDLIFVENNEVRSWLLARGEDPARIQLVESGVDLTSLRPQERSAALMQQVGGTSLDLIVGFSGRWSEEKNPLGFIEIARQVDPELPVRFIMTGAGHLRPAIEQAIREADFCEGRFHLLGEVAEIAPVLGSFDLLVVPSTLDGRPVVVLEALALGVPVLASRVGALPELIEDGETGWLFEPGDLKAFSHRIEQTGRDRGSMLKMRHQVREYAEARLDVQGMFAAYRTGLESLLPKN